MNVITPYTNAHLIDLLTERVKELEEETDDIRQQMKAIQEQLMDTKLELGVYDDD